MEVNLECSEIWLDAQEKLGGCEPQYDECRQVFWALKLARFKWLCTVLATFLSLSSVYWHMDKTQLEAIFTQTLNEIQHYLIFFCLWVVVILIREIVNFFKNFFNYKQKSSQHYLNL